MNRPRRTLPTAILLCLAGAIAAPGGAQDPGPADTPRRLPGAEKVRVDLVLIDVVVRDRKDRPVPGLTREDFDLLVDRLPVDPASIESFEEACAPLRHPGSDPAAPASPGDVEAAPRHIVLYLDFSHMSLQGRHLSLKAARSYVSSSLGPEDRIMILAFKRSLRLVEDFTSSAEALTARIDEMIADAATLDSDVLEESQNLADVAGKPCDASGSSCTARRSLANIYATQEEMRTRRSLRAMEDLMPALAGLRGRKAFVVFSDVMRAEPGIAYVALARTTPEAEGILLTPDLERLTREANAAGVSLYTVHASGLDDSTLDRWRDSSPQSTIMSADSRSTSRGAATRDLGETYLAARSGLDSALALQSTLAAETGGRALQRTSDVGQILDSARQDLACHYLLGYRHNARGDGSRHSLLVKLRPDTDGESRRGLSVRHRPYFIDRSPEESRERLLASALDIPDLFRTMSVEAEAFALAPEKTGRRVLVKATIGLDMLSLIPDGETVLRGEAVIRGEVTRGAEVACRFEHEVPLEVPRSAPRPSRLVFETGCVLQPESYELSLAVLDRVTGEVGALRTPLVVPPARVDRAPYVSEVHLWAHDPDALVVAAGTGRIGMKDGVTLAGLVPHAERRLGRGQEALLTFLLCPAPGAPPSASHPIRIERTLQGDGDAVVADFRELVIAEAPDPKTGCYQIVNTIPARTLGDGVYTFTISLRGRAVGAPVSRAAALAVN